MTENSDEIISLPGYSGKLPSRTFGGYISIPDKKNMYYMFIEAEKKPKDAPILFWTNGGPGCSGLMGLFEEFGPYRPNRKGKLDYNRWTWTKYANIVFVEQPVGVGYSWSKLKKNYTSNDAISAKDNMQFVLHFFKKYPAFKENPLYLTSESYGGHYITLWANEMIKYNKKHKNELKLKGLMIGNPYIDYVSGTAAQIESYWGHQKLPIESWKKFTKKNCHKLEHKKNWRKTWKKNKCESISYDLEDQVGKHNPYAMDYPICISDQQNALINHYRKKKKNITVKYRPCIDTYTKKYLNRKDVRKSLNTHSGLRVNWKPCSDISKYRYSDTYNNLVPILNKLLNDPDVPHLDVFIMSGTNDAICGTVGTQKWIEDLDIKPKKKWKQYFVNKEPAGYISTYKANKQKKFALATVNFAGHEVPLYKPQAAYELMKKYLNKTLM